MNFKICPLRIREATKSDLFQVDLLYLPAEYAYEILLRISLEHAFKTKSTMDKIIEFTNNKKSLK